MESTYKDNTYLLFKYILCIYYIYKIAHGKLILPIVKTNEEFIEDCVKYLMDL